MVLASTSEVYGKSDKVPFREDGDLVLGNTAIGRWSYAASKALDEFLALSYWKVRKIPVLVARFFNTVGPRQTGRYGMVLPNFVRQALDNSPITVYGQRQTVGDVHDTVECLLRLVASDRAVGEVVNIGNDEEVSIQELAKIVKRRTKSSSQITYTPYEPGFEDMHRRVRVSKSCSCSLDGGREGRWQRSSIVLPVTSARNQRSTPRAPFSMFHCLQRSLRNSC